MYSMQIASLGPYSRVRRTLAFRLMAVYALVGLFLVTVAIASLYFVLRSELEKSNSLFVADKVHVLRTLLRERPQDEEGLREEVELEAAARRYEQFYIRLLDQQNAPLLMTPGMENQVDLDRLTAQTRNHPDRISPMSGRDQRVFRVTSVSAPVGADGSRVYTLQIAVDVSQQEALLARYRLCFWGILFATFLVYPVIGYQIARHGIRPIEEIATTARHITSTNLRERIVSEGYPSELADLAATFNQMLDRLEASFARISMFSADIAHDLRTPVNNIRGEAEVALSRARTASEYRDVIESCLEEAVRLSDLIGDLLFLERAEGPLSHLRREPVDMGELLGKVRDYFEAPAADAQVSLTTSCEKGPHLAVIDRSLLQRAVSNLVANALAYTPRGGTVVLSTQAHASSIRIEVADNGVGIPAEALPRVFDRFFRVDSSRSHVSGGTGLGLAIVKSIAVLHGGDVVIASQPGQGTRVTLEVPISAEPCPASVVNSRPLRTAP